MIFFLKKCINNKKETQSDQRVFIFFGAFFLFSPFSATPLI